MRDGAGLVIIFSPITFIATLYVVYSWFVYREIKRTGVVGFGRIISCDRKHYDPVYTVIVAHYEPIIGFSYAEKHYEMRPMGSFLISPPGKVGDEVPIIFCEKYPSKVVMIRDKNILESYAALILFCLAMCVATLHLMYLGWGHSVGY